jgi:hypothetical protein
MATAMILWLLGGQALSTHHVRSNEAKISALIATGLATSATFQHLVETLDRSDVIVYVDTKLTHPTLGAYLVHTIVVTGGVRYLHIAIDAHGAERHVVPLLAHELQHAVEVASDPTVHDSEGMDKLFERLAIQFGCGETSCAETQAAKDIEATVSAELKPVAR